MRRAFQAEERKKRLDSEGIQIEVDKELGFEKTIDIVKANDEEQTVTGVVLEPDTFDAQETIMTEKVIGKAAHKFLSRFNKSTKLGLQHKDFKKRFDLYESFTAPQTLSINKRVIKKGSWVVMIKVLDSEIWKKVKKREITGFSIGGKAHVKKISG